MDSHGSCSTYPLCVVELPNGESAQVTHVGSVLVSTNLTLQHVLCVPSFSFNLLSVSKLTQKLPYCIVFLSHFCFIWDHIHWWTIGKGEVSNGLYLLQNITSASAVSPSSLQDYLSQFRSTHSATISAQVSVQDTSSLWHFMLGHPSFKRLLPLKDVLSLFLQIAKMYVLIVLWQSRKFYPFHSIIILVPTLLTIFCSYS